MNNRETDAVEGDMFGDVDEYGYDAVVVGSGYGGSAAACRMSMMGIKVCLLEKGRRWEANDFPTETSGMILKSAFRVESKNLGITFGSKHALFQAYEQDDSLAITACGLGGGSLVNAGVIVPTSVRARRNPKWPKEWEKNREVCEASALAMLRPQSVPVEFPQAKVMRQIAEDEIEEVTQDSINLSINFKSTEEASSDSMGSELLGKCLTCGNCITGCPYNAKNSTDKNYLVSAVQSGCTIKTECQVQYIVRNTDEVCTEGDGMNGKKRRRWRVYINDIDYVTSDFVVISAGVFGTAEILFKSEKRGLSMSERLGMGFSCNGNNISYLYGSSAPLGAYGLEKNQFSKIRYEDRPGPSISSSYTSSLGFTIQSAVLPKAFPHLLLKGFFTYSWPNSLWLLHWIVNKLKNMLGWKVSEEMALNIMGYDESDGRITLEKHTDKICFIPPHDPLLPRKIQALQKITKRLGRILFMSKYRSTSVHLLGGCNAASEPSHGVCNPNGQIFNPKYPSMVHPGLYVCDASLIPCSIGINPCFTVAVVAEHVSRHLVQDVLKYKSSIHSAQLSVVESLSSVAKQYTNYVDKAVDPKMGRRSTKTLKIGTREEIMIKETMTGYIEGMTCTAYLIMQMNSRDPNEFDEKNLATGKSHPLLRGRVGGYIELKSMDKDNLYIIDGNVDLCEVDGRTPYTQYMNYRLVLASASGSRYILEGKKIMNPYIFTLYAWRESTTLHVTLRKVGKQSSTGEMTYLKGKLNISFIDLLKSLISLKGNTKIKFIALFLQSLLRTYVLQSPRGNHKNFPPDFDQKAYPPSILHDIKTEDGFTISSRQWKCTQNQWQEGDKQKNPVLLINGYAFESYWLPTEPKDLIRTLLENGYETWLLQTRVHPLHPSNEFTIEDMGKFDIPAAMKKIRELHGPSVKVHVIAHCLGGLAIHIALMGGYVAASCIASLCCTNSSMFFKLTTSSLIKMRLPLIPISMKILGENKILPIFENSKTSVRHRLLKFIARMIPRYERCNCYECEVFSGIFGNAFWHRNVSSTLHYCLNQSLSKLPMSAFTHLRKICISGFIIDSNGKNTYLVHPERMTLHTLYISGGKTLLVTPNTTFLANQYMKLHQPGYRHTRVVVEGFGHSDLLIGEESYNRVFPHIISHIETIEERKNGVVGIKGSNSGKEPLSWGDDPYETEKSSFGRLIFQFLAFCLFILLLSPRLISLLL